MGADAVRTDLPEQVAAVTQRVVASMDARIVDVRRAKDLGMNIFFKVEGVDCDVDEIEAIFQEMVFQIQRDLHTPGSWVAANTYHYPSGGQSGKGKGSGGKGRRTLGLEPLALDPAGLAFAVGSNVQKNVLEFMERLVHALQC